MGAQRKEEEYAADDRDDRDKLGNLHRAEIQAVGPQAFDHKPAHAVPDQVEGEDLPLELIGFFGKDVQQDKAEQAPQRLIQKGGMHRLVEGVAAAVDAALDDVAGHAPGQVGVAAKRLLVEEITPAPDALPDQEAQRGQVKHRRRVDLADFAHDQPGDKGEDDPAVDAEPAFPDVEDAQRVFKVFRPVVAEQHIIQPRADKGKNRGHQHHVDHPVGIDVELLGALEGVDYRQQEAQRDQQAVPV